MVLPGLLCAIWWGLALYGTHTAQPLSPDSAHTAVVARNIVRGHGNTIDWIPFHFGLRDQIRHVPDWHGLLGAPVLAALFGVFGVHDELIRVPGLAYTAATGLVAFAFARVVFGAAAGWLACLLTLGSTGLFHYGWIGTDDSGFAFFFTLTLLLCYVGLEEDDRAIPWAGVAGALALLQKQTGLYLFAIFLVVLWLGRGRGSGWRWAAWLVVPFAVAVGAYLIRNHASYGGFGFRLGPLNWLFKAEGPAALYRLYLSPPRLSDVWTDLGPAGVLWIVWKQLLRLLRSVVLPPPRSFEGGLNLLAIGLPCLWLHRRLQSTFTVLVSVAIAGGVAFICGFYSFEMRYFLMFWPLAAIALAGAIVRAWEEAPTGWIGTGVRGIALATAVGIVISFGAFAAWIGKPRAPMLDNRRHCAEAVEWVRRNVPPDAVILAANPSLVNWATERFTVKMPSGSAHDLRRIGEHYGIGWGFFMAGRGRRAQAFKGWLFRDLAAMRPSCVFSNRGCSVCELHWPPRPFVPSGSGAL